MSRPNRLDLAGIPQHVLQRGVDRRPCFMLNIHYTVYLQLLQEYALRFECDVHAYVLMTNHVHLLVTPRHDGGVGRLIQALGRKYVSFANYSIGRTGTLWEGRYKSCLVGDAPYVLACYRYIEFNPVRARMVRSPEQYPWSSYATNAMGRCSTLVTPHAAYLDLSSVEAQRCTAYMEWIRSRDGARDDDQIRLLTNRQRAFACDELRKRLELQFSRPMGPLKAGRPRKLATETVLEPEL
jgi:putative transposase